MAGENRIAATPAAVMSPLTLKHGPIGWNQDDYEVPKTVLSSAASF
jgi:hypothetical protein